MARARAKKNRKLIEIAEVIAAEWYRVLPEIAGDPIQTMDAFALSAAFNDIVDSATGVEAVLDEVGKPLKIVVPLPPHKVRSKEELRQYLEDNGDFFVGMGTAVLFGCGR